MSANIKERNIIDNTLAAIYENAKKVKAKDVPIGSLVLAKFEESLGDEAEVGYELLITFRLNKDKVRCALPPSDAHMGRIDDYFLKLNEEVVILSAAN